MDINLLDEKYQHGEIHLSSDGFQIRRGSRVLHGFQWTKITEIVAYRLGSPPRDLICLDFVDISLIGWTVHEELVNWPKLVEALPCGLRNVTAHWYPTMLEEGSGNERTVIFKRTNPLKSLDC